MTIPPEVPGHDAPVHYVPEVPTAPSASVWPVMPPATAPAFRPPAPRHRNKKAWWFGLGGLALGLAIGLAFGLLISSVRVTVTPATDIPTAVEKCTSKTAAGVLVMDKGKSLSLQTSGNEASGTSMATVVCVLNGLKAPESLYSKIDKTRALDGTQTAKWPGFEASWNYHPDNGLNVTVETVEP